MFTKISIEVLPIFVAIRSVAVSNHCHVTQADVTVWRIHLHYLDVMFSATSPVPPDLKKFRSIQKVIF